MTTGNRAGSAVLEEAVGESALGIQSQSEAELFKDRRLGPAGAGPLVEASWRRSIFAGVTPKNAATAEVTDARLDCALARHGRPVLEERIEDVARIGCSLILTDASATVLTRLDGNDAVAKVLDDAAVIPGFSLEETVAGTNSAATALESRRTVEVRAHEHLAPSLRDVSGIGLPLVHPVNRRLLGTLNVMSPHASIDPALAAWVKEVGTEITRRFRAAASGREQMLLDTFLGENRDSRHPVICLNEKTIVTNAAASRLLDADDQALLWEHAAQTIEGGAPIEVSMALTDGRVIALDCKPIKDGDSVVGAAVQIAAPRRGSRCRPTTSSGARPDDGLSRLAGSGDRWQKLLHSCGEANRSGSSVLLTGEPGTGKTTIATAMLDGIDHGIVDCELSNLGDPKQWAQELRTALSDGSAVTVVTHLEALSPEIQALVQSLIGEARARGKRIIATRNSITPTQAAENQVLDQFDSFVSVPALRDRLEDLPLLVRSLTEMLDARAEPVTWMPDAIQTLARINWPHNVRSLKAVVRQALEMPLPGVVDARTLPAGVRAAAARRSLSHLEQLEAAAIVEVLEQAGGNKLEAARALGIARSTLYRRMRSLGIDLSETNY